MGAVKNFVEGAAVHADNILDSYKQNPERAVLGINTPYETKLWNSLLGTNYQPNQNDLLTQGSVYTQHDRNDSAAKGINLGSTKGVDAVAQAAAAYFGGQALGGALGGTSGEAPAAGSSSATDASLADQTALAQQGTAGAGELSNVPALSGETQMPAAVQPTSAQLSGAENNAPFMTPINTGASGATAPQQQSQQPGGGAQAQATPAQTPPQAPAPQTSAQPQPQAGQQGMVDKILGQMKANPLATAGSALLLAPMLSGKPQLPQAAQQQNAGAQDAQATAQQLLAQYRTGALSPGQQASLDQLSNQTKNQLRQYFASIGQSDSTAATQALAQVDSQALQMKQQMLDNALNQGLQAIGISGGQLGQIAQMQLGQDQALNNAFANFAGSLGNIAGAKSGTPTTAAPVISSTQKA